MYSSATLVPLPRSIGEYLLGVYMGLVFAFFYGFVRHQRSFHPSISKERTPTVLAANSRL